MSTDIDYPSLMSSGLPAPAPKWQGFPEYNFIGGHNDRNSIPVDDMISVSYTHLTLPTKA